MLVPASVCLPVHVMVKASVIHKKHLMKKKSVNKKNNLKFFFNVLIKIHNLLKCDK